ncbi:MAG TPA: fasciclin domain-containing protein [Niastella sp.]
MRLPKKYLLLAGCLAVTGLCCKKWDDHVAVNEQPLNQTLQEYISTQPDLSKFNEYLVKTGLDKVIGSSKNYTVWAPTNEALKSLPQDVVNDTAKLKPWLLNHIALQLYFTRMATDSIRVPMLNGKRIYFFNKKFDEAGIQQADIYVKNGALHIIDKAVAPLPSIWEYIESTKTTYAQNTYVASLNYLAQDPSQAELDSINPVTGQPVYKPNTGIVKINTFCTKVYDVRNEDSLYTYIVLANAAYATEKDNQKIFFQSANANITDSNAAWNVAKDLVIKGYYPPDKLPSTLLSKFNVHIPISSAAILETKRASNGIIYVVNAAAAPIKEKIPVVFVQSDNPVEFRSREDKYMTKVFYRQRTSPLTGQSFNDIYCNLGSSGANFYVDFITNDLYTTKYKVYWVAINDKSISGQGDDPYGTDSTLQQILMIGADTGTFSPHITMPPAKVQPNNYTEVYLGEYTNGSYDWVLSFPSSTPDGKTYNRTLATRRLRLQAPATTTTGIPFNLTLDYLKFVPF